MKKIWSNILKLMDSVAKYVDIQSGKCIMAAACKTHKHDHIY
ncbi:MULTISPECIES: hypothetical protein [Vitreoscilla]|nr:MULTISPECIES: hypothetical protein [Vitreoscilla]